MDKKGDTENEGYEVEEEDKEERKRARGVSAERNGVGVLPALLVDGSWPDAAFGHAVSWPAVLRFCGDLDRIPAVVRRAVLRTLLPAK